MLSRKATKKCSGKMTEFPPVPLTLNVISNSPVTYHHILILEVPGKLMTN